MAQPQVDLNKLPAHVRHAIENSISEGNKLVTRDLREVLDFYLRWEGIIGYTNAILSIVEAAE